MRLLQKECGKCLRHPFLWIVCITFGLFQFLSIYTYVGNAGMRKELRQMHVAVTDEETASPEYESAYADYKKTYGGMYDTLDMRKILEQKEKKSGYEPQGAWGMWIVRNYDRLQKRVEQIRKTGEGTYAFYPGSWYKLHSTLYGKLWKKLILQERCAGCFMQDCLQCLPSWYFLQRFRFRTCGMFRWRHAWLQSRGCR